MITSGAKSWEICLILDPGCVCQTIVITLKNGAQQAQSKQGIYQRAEKVNGKTSWISSNNINAIWYDTDESGTISDDWIIGKLDGIGGNAGGIASTGNQGMSSCPYDVSKDAWKYYSDSGWIIADANDVSIECLTDNDKDESEDKGWRKLHSVSYHQPLLWCTLPVKTFGLVKRCCHVWLDQNFDPSLLTNKLRLVFVGMKHVLYSTFD